MLKKNSMKQPSATFSLLHYCNIFSMAASSPWLYYQYSNIIGMATFTARQHFQYSNIFGLCLCPGAGVGGSVAVVTWTPHLWKPSAAAQALCDQNVPGPSAPVALYTCRLSEWYNRLSGQNKPLVVVCLCFVAERKTTLISELLWMRGSWMTVTPMVTPLLSARAAEGNENVHVSTHNYFLLFFPSRHLPSVSSSSHLAAMPSQPFFLFFYHYCCPLFVPSKFTRSSYCQVIGNATPPTRWTLLLTWC